jgi:hypothetical protein
MRPRRRHPAVRRLGLQSMKDHLKANWQFYVAIFTMGVAWGGLYMKVDQQGRDIALIKQALLKPVITAYK